MTTKTPWTPHDYEHLTAMLTDLMEQINGYIFRVEWTRRELKEMGVDEETRLKRMASVSFTKVIESSEAMKTFLMERENRAD